MVVPSSRLICPNMDRKSEAATGLLADGFVQNEDGRLHRHDGSQVEPLLLSAGQLSHIFIEPHLEAKVGGQFVQQPAFKKDFPGLPAVRLELPQQGCLVAPKGAAESQKFSPLYCQRHVLDSWDRLFGR